MKYLESIVSRHCARQIDVNAARSEKESLALLE